MKWLFECGDVLLIDAMQQMLPHETRALKGIWPLSTRCISFWPCDRGKSHVTHVLHGKFRRVWLERSEVFIIAFNA